MLSMEMHRDDVTDEASQKRLVVKKRAVVGAGAGDDEFDRQQQTGGAKSAVVDQAFDQCRHCRVIADSHPLL